MSPRSNKMTTLTGLVHGQTIELDERVPELEGKRVRVLVEPAEDSEAGADRVTVWQEWVERGPQGPIEDDGNPEFP
jgi:hypothetical protein